ncbi:MAG: Gfo/Idh/MocA family protein [Myxococcales bacterium]
MTRPRLGFLGVGWIGRHRMECIGKSGAAEIVAIADASPEAAQSALAVAPGARVVGGFGALLESDLDGIVIATPSAQHAEQAIAALRRGYAVFCQKPLGRNAAEARAVLDVAKEADRLLAVDLSYRFTRGMEAIKRLVDEGDLGEVYALNLVFHNAYGPDKPWFYDPRLSGGGCVMDLGIHLVDLALWTLGFPAVARVTAQLFAGGRRLERGTACEDYCAAQLELSTGAVAQLACSWRLSAGQQCVIEASFYGTRGAASLRNVGGSFYDFEACRMRGTAREVLVSPPDEWGGRAAVDWAERLGRSRSFDAEAMHLGATADALDRIYEAA